MDDQSKIIIYRAADKVEIRTQFKDESIWLTQKQITELFEVDRTVITRHLNNIFKSGELTEKSNVQKMHIANSDKPVKLYDLDAVISVGYRVNSQKATDFRIWATRTLRQYLTRGFVINSKKFAEIHNIVQFITSKAKKKELEGHEKEVLDVIERYSKTWKMLGDFDEGKIEIKKLKKTKFYLKYYHCCELIDSLKEELIEKEIIGDLFGMERGQSLEGIIGNLYQTFGGEELYNSVEEKAAHLIYFVIKDHPFGDGNKRIGSLLFLYFLEKNSFLFRNDGMLKINDKTIVALALLIASSDPKEKETIVSLIINLIQD